MEYNKRVVFKTVDGFIFSGIVGNSTSDEVLIKEIRKIEGSTSTGIKNMKDISSIYVGSVVFIRQNIIWWYTEDMQTN